jgi:hypothetical protein
VLVGEVAFVALLRLEKDLALRATKKGNVVDLEGRNWRVFALLTNANAS